MTKELTVFNYLGGICIKCEVGDIKRMIINGRVINECNVCCFWFKFEDDNKFRADNLELADMNS